MTSWIASRRYCYLKAPSKLRPLIDADILLYSCGFAADSQMMKDIKNGFPDAGDEECKEILANEDYLRYALANVKTVILDIVDLFQGDKVLYLTGPGNYRDDIATIQPYKGNRDTTHKPKYYKEIKEYLVNKWGAVVVEGREADDALGCDQWNAERDTTVIVSIDKDLDNIPGWHYNWRKKEVYYVDDEEADIKFWTQALTGDATDHIQGIPGIGPKKAAIIIDGTAKDWESMATAVLAEYEAKFGKEDGFRYFHENLTLLWIQREEGMNYNGEPIVVPTEEEEELLDGEYEVLPPW